MLAQNRIVLERVFPDLYKALQQEWECFSASGSEIELVPTISGDLSVKYRGIWLHSSRNPREESRRILRGALPPTVEGSKQPFILCGFGLGYLAEEIRYKFPTNPLIIIEPNISILLSALAQRDVSQLLGSPGLIFILDRTLDALHDILSLFSTPPLLVIPRPYREIEPELSEILARTVSLWETKQKVNTATVHKFGKRWVRNIIENRFSILELPGIKDLANALSGTPALVLAAGPSLDEVLPYLSAIHERCLIIAVDTALRAALRMGVEPDFVVVVDPQYWNARHLDFCSTATSCLVTEVAVYPSVFHHPFRQTLLCSSLYPLGLYFERAVDIKGRLGAGGSVATTALDFALHLGTGPIWIGGLDLAYPDYKTHFTGALFEERAFTRANRLQPAETQSFRSLLDGKPFYAPSASGGKVLTDTRLSLYTAWFEARLRQIAPGICKSLAPQGIRINGLELGTIEEILSLPIIRPHIRQHLSDKLEDLKAQYSSSEAQKKRQLLWERIEGELVLHISSLCQELKRGLQLLQNLSDTLQEGSCKNIQQQLDEFDRINNMIAESPVKDIAGFLFTDNFQTKSEDSSQDECSQMELYLASLQSFYSSLLESLEFHKKLFTL